MGNQIPINILLENVDDCYKLRKLLFKTAIDNLNKNQTFWNMIKWSACLQPQNYGIIIQNKIIEILGFKKSNNTKYDCVDKFGNKIELKTSIWGISDKYVAIFNQTYLNDFDVIIKIIIDLNTKEIYVFKLSNFEARILFDKFNAKLGHRKSEHKNLTISSGNDYKNNNVFKYLQKFRDYSLEQKLQNL